MDARVVRRVGQVRGAYLLRSLDVERRATRGLDTADAYVSAAKWRAVGPANWMLMARRRGSLWRGDSEVHHRRLALRASALPSVAYSAVQAPLLRAKRDRETDAGRVAADLHFPDPLFTNQWHLVHIACIAGHRDRARSSNSAMNVYSAHGAVIRLTRVAVTST